MHYAEGPAGQLLPCHLTPFAKDASFGYSSSDLNQWVLDKTQGGQGVSKILSLSLHDIRCGPHFVLAANGRGVGEACPLRAAALPKL